MQLQPGWLVGHYTDLGKHQGGQGLKFHQAIVKEVSDNGKIDVYPWLKTPIEGSCKNLPWYSIDIKDVYPPF